jgi:5'(3')-deoxyribonucleotidase
MRIGLDVDFVLYNFTNAYNTWMNKAYGMSLNVVDESPKWDHFEDWGYTYEQFSRTMDESVDDRYLFWQGELYEPQIPQNLHDLRAAGHTIHIVTHRFSGKSSCAKEATRHWFDEKGLIYDTLTFAKDKTVVKTDVFLEDNLDNYDLLEAAGVRSYLVNRPYNLQRDNRRRVNSVDEFSKLILEDTCYSSAFSAAS